MTASLAPGSVVVVRDEEWLVTQVEATPDGSCIEALGLSDLVRGQEATFYQTLDDVVLLDPRDARITPDDSPRYRRARLWVEATLMKIAVPISDPSLTVAAEMLAAPLGYQHKAVRKALDPNLLRPRILLADAVGLGKTLEIGLILAELIRRGRGERILVVTPRHVLEQMQHEMWTRFAIPFVRLDSQGVERVKQKLPANRNPFTFFKRVIVSMDTLKQERFVHDLRRHHWDAVVIDESHNVTNSTTANNRLTRILAPNTDALILASATPHNGRKESFAELVRFLDPTAVTPDGELLADRVEELTIRRHRHSQEVAAEVGADWAERRDPDNRLVPASAAEEAVIDELVGTWLRPVITAPVKDKLFAWTLAKAFLSSPAALAETIANRLARIDDPIQQRALTELARRNDACCNDSAKYDALVAYLRSSGIAPTSTERAVVFSERVATLTWLQQRLLRDLRLKPAQVEVLHGGLPDDQQQAIVESFKQASSPIRLLITGDVASEGVNLHRQCHRLVHYDIPWSLIRIEQRNGRIDRYGQRHSPEIVTLLLAPNNDAFAGDVRVLTKLVEREHEAHQALGDAASLMGQYSVRAEEDAIREVLAGAKDLDDVVATPEEFLAEADDWTVAFLAELDAEEEPLPVVAESRTTLYPQRVDFLRDALAEYYPNPEEDPHGRDEGGVRWREEGQLVEFVPPADLRQRLEVLPQGYLKDRRVTERLRLVTDPHRANQILNDALQDATGSSWPEAHYLGPLHPVLGWAADRALSRLGRGEVFAVRGDVPVPTVLLNGTLLNRAGQVVTSAWMAAQFFAPSQQPVITLAGSITDLLGLAGVMEPRANPGAPKLPPFPLIRPAVDTAEEHLIRAFGTASDAAKARVEAWIERATAWDHEADALIQRSEVRRRRDLVEQARRFSAQLSPDRHRVAPLLVVLPADTEVEA